MKIIAYYSNNGFEEDIYRIEEYMYINFVCHVQMSKYMNKNQDIHLFKSYISVSFKPLKMLCVIFSAVSVSPIYPFLG